MTKNVTVTDAQGNIIGTTYPKRASGLIKNGRAIFVDDCTIRLSGKPEPSDTYNTSEVNQMNYILFNPRNWSFDQMQNNNQGNFGYGRNNGFSQSFPAERSFINDFDGSLVESLLFGDWNTSYARAVSKELALLPDTEYCFVFWLNGGENDKNTEICRLQIAFGGNWEDCYTYKLNRNYIKPVLHKDGWELYSIPFRTPVAYTPAGFGTVSSGFGTAVSGSTVSTGATGTDAVAQSGNSNTAPTVVTHLAFVVGVAPMALKPAKELEFYADWEDTPDEFASERPQRHNLVFADGWPSISQYGGDKYSTEALRAKKARRMENVPPVAGVPPMPNIPPIPDIPPLPDVPPVPTVTTEFTLADDLAEHLDEIEMQRDDLSDRAEGLNNRLKELLSRIGTMTAQGILTGNALDSVTSRVSALQSELQCLENRVNELDNQVDGADLEIEMLGMSSDAAETYLDSLETMLDIEDGHADGLEDSLDSLEEYLDSIA